MYAAELQVENFRGIRELKVSLDDTTFFIGENNTGKSSVLEAVWLLLRTKGGRARSFQVSDLHLENQGSNPRTARPIRITLVFRERTAGEWTEPIVQMLSDVLQVDPGGTQSVRLRAVGTFDANEDRVDTSFDFVDVNGAALRAKGQAGYVTEIRKLTPAFMLTALRDAEVEFDPRGQFWEAFIRASRLDAADRATFETELGRLNDLIIDAHPDMSQIRAAIDRVAEFVAVHQQDPARVEAIAPDVGAVLARTRVLLSTQSGARIALEQHGEGTKNLAVMLLFEAFLQSRLAADFGPQASPLLTLEEPEAHLHPSAIRALGSALRTFAGQKLIASHAADLVASIPLESVRRMGRKNDQICVYKAERTEFSDSEWNKIQYHIALQRGRLLFARCWLFVEGETEFLLLPAFASLLGILLEVEGIACVEYRNFDIDPLLRLAEQLGIQWHFLAGDSDLQGIRDLEKVRAVLQGRNEGDFITHLHAQDIEHFLWDNGFSGEYEAAVSAVRRRNITAQVGTPEYVDQVIDAARRSQSKPMLAIAVGNAATAQGVASVPTEMRQLIEAARDRAREVR